MDEIVVTAPPEDAAPETPPHDPTAFGTVIDTTEAAANVETVADLLVDAGHDPARIRTERFGPTS